ncbi:tRNA lysidine(34) synthetase TilS [Shimia sp. R10_1]|uniref:tRNA lysidine(34) synthetase TilS n=1 Tax=Shimia sp. R10_1 TaxID=2821095 RepID=UPI0032AFA3BF
MSLTSLAAALTQALQEGFGHTVPERIGVAVSGGGDSMALLDLLRVWGKAELYVASVDHGLRPESAEEVASVADYVAHHGLKHTALRWDWDRQGNLQQAAREGRRRLLRDWAGAQGLGCVALGHTADDQAETFLMRLARGSGVDGLSAMEPARKEGDITWVRPLLKVRRETLRAYLRERGLAWADDPSNDDETYDRIKARQMMATLEPLGLSVARLTQTSDHMRAQRGLADWAVERAEQDVMSYDVGDVLFDRTGLKALPDALQARLISKALGWVSGNSYRPRFKALAEVLDAHAPKALHGCLVIPKAGMLRISREWNAVKDLRTGVDAVWDGRWRLARAGGGVSAGLEIAALGEAGMAQVPDWRLSARPRQSVLSSPAVWQGDTLVSAPLAGLANGWEAQVLAP